MPTFGYKLALFCSLIPCVGTAVSTSPSSRPFLVLNGRPEAAIVAGVNPFDRFVAGELHRYIQAMTGAELQVVTPETAQDLPKSVALLLVGPPSANELVQRAVYRKQVSFDGLKPEGFILRTIRFDGHWALIVGGNDEAGTMYGAYDLIERYGAVFLLTEDILPEPKPDLELRSFDIRSEPSFPRRGQFVSFIFPNRSIMSLDDERHYLDQMAKMKMNYLQIFWFPYEPWLNYAYRGETKLMGDVASKETAYVLWARNFGSFLTTEMEVGREHFKAAGVYPSLAPPEFQNIENNEQAFEAAQKYLHTMIAYALSRKIKVWLAIDATSVVPNLGRYTTRALTLPFNPIFGTFMCPDDPVSSEINEQRLKALLQTYPEAEGYFLYIPEAYPVCRQSEEDRKFYFKLREQYPGEAAARAAWTLDIPPDNDTVIDSNSGSIYLIQRLMEARDRVAPRVKLGIGGLGRLYLWPYLNKMFPKEVPFTDWESSGVWTPSGVPMEMFAGMGGRENTLVNRLDDDSAMLGMQFNVNLYYKDRVLQDSSKYGLAGFASQMNRARGGEQNSKYMAEGAWNPHLTPEEFYRDYCMRIFGQKALPHVLKAFQLLEKNEEFLEWKGRTNFPCCGPPLELSLAYQYYKQPDPFDGPAFSQATISWAYNQASHFRGSIGLLSQALDELKKAKPEAAPRSQQYLAYLTNRTAAYILHLRSLVNWEQAYVDLYEAFQTKARGSENAKFLQELDASLGRFQEARRDARAMAEKWSEIIDHPSDLGALYRINTFMVRGTALTEQLIQNVDNFHHGRPYWKPADFDKVFTPWPEMENTRNW